MPLLTSFSRESALLSLFVSCAWGVALGRAKILSGADTVGACSSTEIRAAVIEAFATVHDGWSSDEVLLQDELNARFVAECRKRCPNTNGGEFNWRLINLRKASQLSRFEVTKRNVHRHDAYRHAAEIAARLVTERHEISTDRMLCVAKLRAEFDQTAGELAPDVPAYRLRKAAFGLRKSRRLRPELVVRVANWGREIRSAPIDQLRRDPAAIPASPGIYLFRDESGYLYVGEAADLRKRLRTHLICSDRTALADYLSRQSGGAKSIAVEMHIFPLQSPAAEVRMRRAYESALIDSRRPRFNVRP